MDIQRVIIHRIGKRRGTQGEEVPVPANEAAVLQNKTDFLIQFVENIRSIFNGSGSAVFGQFNTDVDEFPFSCYLTDFLENSEDSSFLSFCQRSTRRLYNKIRNIYSAKVDFAIYIQYKEREDDFIFVVILNNIDSALVGDDGQLTSAPTLDIQKLHHAGRINISQWQISGEDEIASNYLSFISRKESGVSGAGYFRDFIGGAEYTDSDQITRNLKTTVKAFALEHGLEVDVVIRDSFDYLSQNLNEEISITSFSNRVFPDCSEFFLSFAHERGVPGEFKPSKKEIKRFKKLSLKNQDYSINLDRDLFERRLVLWEESRPQWLQIRVATSDTDKIRTFLSNNDNTGTN